jgi:Fic family protein
LAEAKTGGETCNIENLDKRSHHISKIEGTRTNIADALSEERDIDPEKRDDWLEVHNYVKAISNG